MKRRKTALTGTTAGQTDCLTISAMIIGNVATNDPPGDDTQEGMVDAKMPHVATFTSS